MHIRPGVHATRCWRIEVHGRLRVPVYQLKLLLLTNLNPGTPLILESAPHELQPTLWIARSYAGETKDSV